MNRLILADDQAIFRAGAARVLALEDDMRIVAQCEDLAKLAIAIDSFRGSAILVSSGLHPDFATLFARTQSLGSRVILVTENGEQLPDDIAMLLDGIVCRSVAGPDLVDCVRRVVRGQRYVQRANVTTMHATDSVGTRVRAATSARLSPLATSRDCPFRVTLMSPPRRRRWRNDGDRRL